MHVTVGLKLSSPSRGLLFTSSIGSSSCCCLPALDFGFVVVQLVGPNYVTKNFMKFSTSALPVWWYLHFKTVYDEGYEQNLCWAQESTVFQW